ncbi:MAG: hypothetical protein WBP26_05630 [Candidatus Saccharimonadales bacterium]
MLKSLHTVAWVLVVCAGIVMSMLFSSSVVSASSRVAAYDPLSGVCSGSSPGAASPTCAENKAQQSSNTNPLTGKDGLIMKISIIIASIAGIVAVIMVIVGGAGMITSGGDAGKIKTSRERIVHALIGVVVIALAQALVAFVVINLF